MGSQTEPDVVSAPSAIALVSGLTEQELEILYALVDGLSNKEIAARQDLSTRTINMHVRHLFDRLNCRTRTEAVRIALEKKWLPSRRVKV
jgi:DNA-binding NarL/FixJ family response regulator